MIWFRALPLLWQIGIELTLILGLCTAFAVWKHGVWKDGYNQAMTEVSAKAAARVNQAHIDSVKIGEKHEKIRMHIRAQVGYDAPSSPLVTERVRSYTAASTDRRGSGMRGSASSGSHH